MAINVIVQYNDRSLPDNLLLIHAPIIIIIIVVWFDGPIIVNYVLLCLVALHGD